MYRNKRRSRTRRPQAETRNPGQRGSSAVRSLPNATAPVIPVKCASRTVGNHPERDVSTQARPSAGIVDEDKPGVHGVAEQTRRLSAVLFGDSKSRTDQRVGRRFAGTNVYGRLRPRESGLRSGRTRWLGPGNRSSISSRPRTTEKDRGDTANFPAGCVSTEAVEVRCRGRSPWVHSSTRRTVRRAAGFPISE
jgi:hypothetical protein